MKYNKKEQEEINALFLEAQEKKIPCAILRDYYYLPKKNKEDQIKVLIDADNYIRFLEILKKREYIIKTKKNKKNIKTNLYNLKEQGKKIVRNPAEIKNNLKKKEYNTNEYTKKIAKKERIILILVNRLAYESPLNRKMIRVDEEVEKILFSNKKIINELPVISETDLLVHLLCLGIFTYDGSFPREYEDLCKKLTKELMNTKEGYKLLKETLSHIFYRATPIVMEGIKNRKCNQIKKNLKEFSKY